MTLRAVFLDVGNTLVREKNSRFALYAEAARTEGIEVSEDRMGALMRSAHRELPLWIDGSFRYSDLWFRAFIERIFRQELGLPAARLEALTQHLFDLFEQRDTFRILPGAVELLDTLEELGLARGIISNWSARLPRVLAELGLDGRFDFVLCSALEGAEKPSPQLFERALDLAGARPDQAVHAGDHPVYDVEAASALGITPFWVQHEERDTSSRPEGLRGDLWELRSYILSRGGKVP